MYNNNHDHHDYNTHDKIHCIAHPYNKSFISNAPVDMLKY